MTGLKYVLNIFTWCIMFMVLLWTLGACATGNTYPRVERETFMARALEFDRQQAGLENTREYQQCYSNFQKFMWEECKELADAGMMPEFWGCADAALDEMEDCTNDK